MDLIEDQITEAIDARTAHTNNLRPEIPIAAPGSPTSLQSSLAPASYRVTSPGLASKAHLAPTIDYSYRPGTMESAMSSASRLTGRTDAISILGLARKGYGGSHEKRGSVDVVGGSGARDDVATRIALIQAKVSEVSFGIRGSGAEADAFSWIWLSALSRETEMIVLVLSRGMRRAMGTAGKRRS